MKKFLNMFLAAVLLLVSAESLYAADLKVNGEYRVRAYSYNDIDAFDQAASDGADYIDQRFLLTGTISQGITSGVVQVDFATCPVCGASGYVWGTNPGLYGGQTFSSSVHQAYLNVTFPMANLMAGRRNIKLGHGLILNDTADNLALRIPLEMVSVDLAYLKLLENDLAIRGVGGLGICPGGPCNQDLDRSGYLLNVGLKPIEAWNIGLFYVTDVQKVQVGDNSSRNVFGLSADGQAGPVGIALEYDNLGGTRTTGIDYKGQNLLFAASGDVGVAKVGIGYLRVTGRSASATETSNNSLSGDFVGGNGIFLVDQTRYNGGVDLNTQAADLRDTSGSLQSLSHNFHAIKLYADANPMDNLMVGLEIFPFIHVVDTAVATYTGAVLSIPDDNIGTEVNVTAGYQIDKNLKLSGVAAFFNAGDAVKDVSPSGTTKNVTKFNAALTYTF